MILLRQPLMFIVILLALAACVPTPNHVEATPAQATPIATQPACQPSQTQPSKNSFPEVRGTMKSDGELWALLFFDQAHARQDEKIVWRMTGTGGPFEVQAQHEDGTIIRPIWGPKYHGGSNWERPGDEWGTGFNFPEPGCWTLTVTRGATVGEIRLEVLAP
jgi:hypothetical protein